MAGRGSGREEEQANQAAQAWHSAQSYAWHLASGGAPAQVFAGGVLLEPGEVAAFHTGAIYERFWGGDGRYTHTSGFFLGSIPFIAAGFAATAVANSVRKRHAANQSVPVWRETQDVAVIATNRRLLIQRPGQGLLSFWYSGMQEFYPAPTSWTMAMVWPETAPLRLSGLSTPYLSVHVAAHVMPGEWTRHPALAELIGGPQDRPAGRVSDSGA